MRNWDVLCETKECLLPMLLSYLTYEELRHDQHACVTLLLVHVVPYLWGIETHSCCEKHFKILIHFKSYLTYEELRRSFWAEPFSSNKDSSRTLPMRNWDGSCSSFPALLLRFCRTLPMRNRDNKGIHLCYSCRTLPMRNWDTHLRWLHNRVLLVARSYLTYEELRRLGVKR